MAGGVVGGVVLALVAVAIVGVRRDTGGDDRLGRRRLPGPDLDVDRSEPPGWDTITDPPEVEPFALSPAPLWGSAPGSPEPGPVEVVRGAALRGNSAVLWGGGELPVTRLSVVDLATGTERWGLGVLEDLPGQDAALYDPYELTSTIDDRLYQPAIVDRDDGGWSVVTAYLAGYNSVSDAFVDCGCDDGTCIPPPGGCLGDRPTGEQGVAALAGDDGRVLWKAPVVPGVPAGQLPEDTLLGVVAGGGTVLAVLGPLDATAAVGGPPPDQTRVVALDAATGHELWEAPGVWPVGVSGDTVLGLEGGRPFDIGATDPAADTTVVALDARTGERRWDRPGRFPQRTPQPVVGDVVLVEVPADGAGSATGREQTEIEVLEAAGGDEVASFGRFVLDCRTDGSSLIACAVYGSGGRDRLATFRVDDREAGVSEEQIADLVVDGIWRDSVFVTSWDVETDDAPGGPRQLVDLAGRPVAEDLRGTVLAASDRYVILSCGGMLVPCPDEPDPARLRGTYAVHEITGADAANG